MQSYLLKFNENQKKIKKTVDIILLWEYNDNVDILLWEYKGEEK